MIRSSHASVTCDSISDNDIYNSILLLDIIAGAAIIYLVVAYSVGYDGWQRHGLDQYLNQQPLFSIAAAAVRGWLLHAVITNCCYCGRHDAGGYNLLGCHGRCEKRHVLRHLYLKTNI